MAGRRLDTEERALWRRVTRDVRALDGRHAREPDDGSGAPPISGPNRTVPPAPAPPAVVRPKAGRASAAPTDTLDGSWDRRLGRGLVVPDMTIDLHGHTQAAAHRALDAALARAVAQGVRVLLVVTGRAPRQEDTGAPPLRGVIRAAIGDWLGASSYADRIAAVRHAHRRHGGAGALYVILRRSVRNGGNGRIP